MTGETERDRNELPIWSNGYELVAWVRYRDPRIVRLADSFEGLAGQNIYGSEPKIGSVKDALAALQGGRLVAYGARGASDFAEIPPVEWTRLDIAPLDHRRNHPYTSIKFKQEDVLGAFPATKPERMSHADAVQWCEAWIAQGRGNGMDKAWNAFKMLPEAKGQSRDNCFRPAWIEAKTKANAASAKSRGSTRDSTRHRG